MSRWEERPTEDLLGRILYHQEHIRYWEARHPRDRTALEMVRSWEASYYALVQAIVKRGVELPVWTWQRDVPFR